MQPNLHRGERFITNVTERAIIILAGTEAWNAVVMNLSRRPLGAHFLCVTERESPARLSNLWGEGLANWISFFCLCLTNSLLVFV